MPKWSPLLGHLEILPKLLKELPTDADQSYPFVRLSHDFTDSDGLFYMDLWPFFQPILVISSPNLAFQACQEYDLPKPEVLKPFFAPIAGGPTLFETNGPEWKRSRSLFNPAFSANAILDLTASIVQEAEVYVEILREHVKSNDLFCLDGLTCWYMMDVIGAGTL
jgi:cytochrome P450